MKGVQSDSYEEGEKRSYKVLTKNLSYLSYLRTNGIEIKSVDN